MEGDTKRTALLFISIVSVGLCGYFVFLCDHFESPRGYFKFLGILEKLCGRFVSLFGCFCLFMIPLSLFLVVLCFFVVLSVFDILQLKPTGLLTP